MEARATFAANLKRRRLALDLSQADLGARVGVKYQTIMNYENAQRWPEPEMIDALAKAVEATPAQLLADETAPTNGPTPEESLRSLAKHFGYRLVRI